MAEEERNQYTYVCTVPKEGDSDEVSLLKWKLRIAERALSLYEDVVEHCFGDEYKIPDTRDSERKAYEEIQKEEEARK